MAYRIKLDIFEGPFDLLLFLIKKNEVDIYDIPIHEITVQFLEYVELIKMLDLEIAGEFIEMVAILMNIKARLLLPAPVGIGEDEIEDPRTELVERLLEYQRFKLAGSDMGTLEDKKRLLYNRAYFPAAESKEEVSTEEFLKDISLFDLLLAFKKALDNMPKVTYHEVHRIEVTIEQQTQFILNQLQVKNMVLFSELVREIRERIVIIVTFVALLEMIRARRILVNQSELFDDIRIKLKNSDDISPAKLDPV
jgi:segregation and condensation protein A